jgi:deoxyribose-phosphate aldolase
MINPKIVEAAVLNQNVPINSIYGYVDSVSKLGIKGVCFPSSVVNIPKLRNFIEESSYSNGFDIIGVVGYPNGDTSISSKLAEISDMCGFAGILDIVLNPLYIQSGMWDYVRGEMIELFVSTNAEVRWIIEVPTLTNDQVIRVSSIITSTGGHIKTASGIKGCTTVDHVKLLRSIIDTSGKKILLKASGGIKSHADALSLVYAGADLLGCSTPSSIL